MRRVMQTLFALVAVVGLSACGTSLPTVASGGAYSLASDMSVRLTATHPTVRLLSLVIEITSAGSTTPEALVPNVAVTPEGGSETNADLKFAGTTATITMTLEDAQDVQYVDISDVRSNKGARWDVTRPKTWIGCASDDQCQLLGLPQSKVIEALP